MLLSRILLAALLIAGSRAAGASPWAIVTDFEDATIHTIDLGTSPPTVYGPFLNGQVIPQTHLGAVKVLPGGRFALLSGAYANMYLVNITDPTMPFVAVPHGFGSYEPGLAVSQDGRFAAVATDSALAGFVRLPELSLGGCGLPGRFETVAIAPNNTTVIFGDISNDQLVYGEVKPTFDCLEPYGTIATVSSPTKVAVAQDGETVLAAGVALNDEVRIFQLTPAGLVPGNPPRLEVGAQSFAFEPNGNRVYALSWGGYLSILRVQAPGEVSIDKLDVVSIPTYIAPGYPRLVSLPGIDMMAITPDGGRLIVGDSSDTYCWLVQLSNLSVTSVNTSGRFPTGIDVFVAETPTPTATPTAVPPTATPTFPPPQAVIPTLSFPMMGLLALALAAVAVLLVRR